MEDIREFPVVALGVTARRAVINLLEESGLALLHCETPVLITADVLDDEVKASALPLRHAGLSRLALVVGALELLADVRQRVGRGHLAAGLGPGHAFTEADGVRAAEEARGGEEAEDAGEMHVEVGMERTVSVLLEMIEFCE